MKFLDGYWRVKDGLRVHYPVAAHEVDVADDSLILYAPVHPVLTRGDTLTGPMLTVRLASPMADVIRVTVTHFAGTVHHGPDFPVTADAAAVVSTSCDAESAVLTAGRLSAVVSRADWRIDFTGDGQPLTSSGSKSMGIAESDAGEHFVHDRLGLGVGELVYGLGERFGAFVKNGQSVDIWNEDGGTSSEQAYKNVPFYLTNRGYGVFVNHPGMVRFEVASEVVSQVQFSVQGQELDYFVIYGPTPKEILARYTALTGRPALPPAWSFGLWLSTSFTTSYDEETVTSFVDGMAARDLPLSVFHFDCFWMRAFHWSDFVWDPATFPDPAGMLRRLHERGLRISAWINPYIAQRSYLFAEGVAGGYLLRRANGDVWQWDRWQPGMALVDFTNPAARAWFADKLRELLDTGVDCLKTDFGERVPTDVVWHDGSDPERMHNFYTYLYNETVFDVLVAHRGEGDAVLFARSATAGTQKFPVHWGGDSESTFASMAETLRGGLSLGSSGFAFWSHDIGGFEGKPAADVFKRWVAFGLLSSHSRLHGSQSVRVPWAFDEEAVDVLRTFTRLKYRLMPYLFQLAVEATQSGVPVMRSMAMEFPADPACGHLDTQYMLGSELLVAPVFSADGSVRYYVPAGEWTDVLTGRVVAGPGWVTEQHSFLSVPLLARPGSVVAFGAHDDVPNYDFGERVRLVAFRPADGASVTVRVPTSAGKAGRSFVVSRAGDEVRAEAEDGAAAYELVLVGVPGVHAVDGGELLDAETPWGAVVVAATQAVCKVRLSS